LTTHGGSLRVYGCHEDDPRATSSNVDRVLESEVLSGLRKLATYEEFQVRADKIKDDLLLFLLEQKSLGKVVVAYGAAAKGNTLLNYAGVKPDLLRFVCDAGIAKQGKYMPGSHVPILSPGELDDSKADYVLILPWNIAKEVTEQLENAGINDVQYVTAVPHLNIK
jgi:hypothetical protein